MSIDKGLIALLVGAATFITFLLTLPEPDAATDAGEVAPASEFAIVDVLVFDGEGFLEHRDVWIEGGRIKVVGRKLDLPADLLRIDGRGHTLMPGMIDGHVHTFGGTLDDALRFGVTSVFDQFTAVEIMQAERPARTALAATDQADLYTAGMIATAPSGHGTQFGVTVEPVSGPGEAHAWVRERRNEGSDWIKIAWEDGSAFDLEIASLDEDTVAALIAAAHAHGMLAVVHVSTLERALIAQRLGADGLVHVWADEVIGEEDAAAMAQSGMFVIPTLSVVASFAGERVSAELLEGPDAALLSPMQRQTLGNAIRYGEAGSDMDVAVENVRRLHAAGVTLIAGTDAPNPGTGSGISMHGELQLLVQAGLDHAAALAAATGVAARAFGLEDRGLLAEEQLADLVLVRGDLREDLAASRDIVTIWKDGFPVARAGASAEATPVMLAPEDRLISDFEDGVDASFGSWQVTTDAMRGGGSSAELSAETGALRVQGELLADSPYPWSGAMYIPAEGGMLPLRFEGRSEIRFRVRGDGRTYQLMVFRSATPAGAPPMAAFTAGPDWTEVVMPLDGFGGGEAEVIAALAFVAVQAPGSYALELDDLEIR